MAGVCRGFTHSVDDELQEFPGWRKSIEGSGQESWIKRFAGARQILALSQSGSWRAVAVGI